MCERITDNFNPTDDDVREWGYDEALFFMEQDEDLLLYGLYYVPVLLELAQDPACPKQHYALSILGHCGTTIRWVQEFKDSEVATRIRHIVEPVNEQNLDRLESVLAEEKS